MSAIPTILKGDDSSGITISIASGRSYTGSVLLVAYQGIVRRFSGLVAGGSVNLSFTHEETSGMRLGCRPVLMRLVGPGGAEETVENAEFRIKVTDCLGEVNSGGSFMMRPGQADVPVTDLGDIPDRFTDEDIRTKVNAIIRTLARRSLTAVLVSMVSFGALAASVQSALKGTVMNDQNVVTNVDLSGLATESYVQGQITSAGAITESGVRSIVTEMGSEFGKVQSVNGKTGTVTLAASDVGALTQAGGDARYLKSSNGNSWITWGQDGNLMFYNSGQTMTTFNGTVYSEGQFRGNGICAANTYGPDGKGNLWNPVVYGITTNAAYDAFHTKWLHADVDLTPIATDARDAKAAAGTLATQVSAIGAHLNAEDARFVVTNYDSTVRIPEAKVEIKLPDQSWTNVWNEMTRWNRFSGTDFAWDAWGGFESWRTNVESELSFKAERNWGMYDSETGVLSPDGYLQISSSNILIAAGMAYQRTVTCGGSVWVLQCNSGTARIGGTTNGFFRVLDGDGNVQFEIVKGDKLEIGANASGITVDDSTSPPTVTIPYSVEAESHPKISCSEDLSTWKTEDEADCLANVTWSGSSGAYVATVQRKTAGSQLFVKATYMVGGETYIRNNAPVSMDSIIVNGTNFYLGTAVINGNTVLTLRTTR